MTVHQNTDVLLTGYYKVEVYATALQHEGAGALTL